MKKITLLLLMLGFSSLVSAQCFNAEEYGQWPSTTYVPETCDGVTVNVIRTNCYAGEYSVVSVVEGQTYVFGSSVATDFLTVSADEGVTAVAFGEGSVTWVSDVTGEVWFFTHTDAACGEEDVNRSRTVICGVVSTDAPDYANLQFPSTATITEGGSVDVYGQVYEGGLTDVAPNIDGQAPGIQAWVGISPEGENTDPATWTTWIESTFNAAHISNNDEYMASIGADLDPGTYYYATRFRLNDGVFVYGGINASNNGNFWNGTEFNSGVLTIEALPAPANDACATATAITEFPYTFQQTDGSASTNNDGFITTCGNAMNDGLWYTVVGDGSNITVTITPDPAFDPQLGVYSGECGALVCEGTVDLGGNGGAETYVIVASEVGATYFMNVGNWSGTTDNDEGSFTIDVISAVADPLPECAMNPTPIDGAVDVPVGDVVFSWEASATGGVATSYDFYGGVTTPLTEDDFIGNYTTTSADITITGYDLLLYWKVVPRNLTGEAVGCMEWSFTTESAPPAPANDACSGAIAITEFPYTFEQTDGAGATNNDGFITGCTDAMNDGVWFTVVGDGNNLTINITPDTTFDPQIGVYSGTCGALTCVGTADDGFFAGEPETFEITASEAGTTYYINVGFWGGDEDEGDGLEGSFTIDVTSEEPLPAPANDACANATVITTPYEFEQTDGAGATNNDGFDTVCTDAMNDGVWYTVAGDGGDITFTITPEASYDPQVNYYSGACGTFTCLGTADSGFEGDSETFTITESVIGTNYYVNIGHWDNNDDEAEGSFSIEVTSTVLGTPSFDASNFKVYPNPVSNVLNLSYTENMTNVEIFNLLGQRVISKEINANKSEIDMSLLSAGTYLVKVMSETEFTTVKVVKQ